MKKLTYFVLFSLALFGFLVSYAPLNIGKAQTYDMPVETVQTENAVNDGIYVGENMTDNGENVDNRENQNPEGENLPQKGTRPEGEHRPQIQPGGGKNTMFYSGEEDKKPSKEEILRAWADFSGEPQKLHLPSAPKQFLHYFEENDRPQAKLDRMLENGMAVSVGRLREDILFDYKFVCLSHNTLRGAAGGAVLMAELLAAKGYLD